MFILEFKLRFICCFKTFYAHGAFRRLGFDVFIMKLYGDISAVKIKVWYVTPCGLHDPEAEGTTSLRNACNYIPADTTQRRRKLESLVGVRTPVLWSVNLVSQINSRAVDRWKYDVGEVTGQYTHGWIHFEIQHSHRTHNKKQTSCNNPSK